MNWRVSVAVVLVALGTLIYAGCGDDEEGQDECEGFCLEEGMTVEEQIAAICEAVCEKEEECYGDVPGGISGCTDECTSVVTEEYEALGRECIDAQIVVAECMIAESCDEFMSGWICEEEFDAADDVCDYRSPGEPEPGPDPPPRDG